MAIHLLTDADRVALLMEMIQARPDYPKLTHEERIALVDRHVDTARRAAEARRKAETETTHPTP